MLKGAVKLQEICSGGAVHLNKQGVLESRPKIVKEQVSSIEKWTDAFLIFSSIFLKKHPSKTQELLQYMSIIREATSRSPSSFAWRQYDEHFRLRQATQAQPWNKINADLWLRVMTMSTHTPAPSDARPTSKTSLLHNHSELFSLAKSQIKLEALEHELMGYDIQKGNKFYRGFSSGFSLHYSGARAPSDPKNLRSAVINAVIVKQKIQAEIDAGRVANPFDSWPIPTLRVLPLGLVPKWEPGEYRLIHHLSYPSVDSVNDFIDRDLCSVQYTSFDEAVHMVQDLGRACLLGKSDIKSAFRLLPVSPSIF